MGFLDTVKNTFGNIAKDTAKGASMGSAVPGVGTLIGAGIGSTIGGVTSLIEAIHGRKDKQAADNLQPSLYDPQQQAFLAEINQKRKSINSGSAFAADMGDINQSQQGTDQAIVQNGGGDSAGTIAGLLTAETNAGRLKNQVLGNSMAEGQFYNTFGNSLLDSISARSLQLQLAQQSQRRAQWAQESQDAYGNATNAAARMGNGNGMNWADLFHKHDTPDHEHGITHPWQR